MSLKLNELLSTRENNFDFIRFSAALAVIFSHSFDLTSNYDKEPLRIFSNGASSIGEIAVIIFFITSGFLIMQSYSRTQSVSKYFLSRALRIYPGLIFVILCTVFIIGPIITSLSLSEYFFNLTTIKYLFNAISIKISFHLPGVFENNPFPRDAVNGSLWSLPYEILCYIWVAAAGAIAKRKYSLFLILTFITLLFLPFMLIDRLFTYTFYFLCGSLIYIYRSKVSLHVGWLVVMLIVLPINLGYNSSYVIKTLVNGICLGYTIIFLATIKIPTLHSFSKYGDFSYGLYVWAFPVQQLIAYKYNQMNNYYNFLISSIITLVIAFFSWHIIEKRGLALKKYSFDKLEKYPFIKNKADVTTKELLEVE